MTDHNPIYNLKAVIHETGLSPETLRAWERRYGLLKPQRSPGGHRLYSQFDIDMLQWLVSRQKEGLSISRAVEMWRSLETNGQDPLQQIHAPQIVVEVGGSMLDDLRQGWLEACLAFDEQSAERVLSQAFAIEAPEMVCTEVIQKGLAEIGQRWVTGHSSVQQEHFASALAMQKINALLSADSPPTRPERILAACPPGEEHDFGLLLVAFLLRRSGWEVIYLGANVPLSQLAETLQLSSPRLVLSVAQTLTSAVALRDMADEMNAHGVPLAYGGGIFTHTPAITECIPAYYLGKEISAVPQMVERLLARFPPLPAGCTIPPAYSKALEDFVENESLIIASVAHTMRSAGLEPSRLENINTHLTHNIAAALALGDIQFLHGSVSWLESMFDQGGLLPERRARYLSAYRQAVKRNLGDGGIEHPSAAIILEGLAGLEQL